jgi:hypothetical protein
MPSYIPANLPISRVRKGNYFERAFSSNIDFSSKQATFVVSNAKGVVLLSVSTPQIVLSPTQVTVSAPASLMKFGPGVFDYRLDVFTTSDDVQTVLEGQLEVYK